YEPRLARTLASGERFEVQDPLLMMSEPFSSEAVMHALRDVAVASVDVIETFRASSAEVARLRVALSDGREPFTAIGKSATGAGLAAARRELRFFQHLAPCWDHPAPGLLGAWEERHGEHARLLLVTEDLGARGYALPRDGVSEAQLDAVTDTLATLHTRFWEDLFVEVLDPAHPAPSVTRAAQAWPAGVIGAHAAAARDEAARFLEAVSAEITVAERALLQDLLEDWEHRFQARAAGGRSITLIHGDFHLLGNIFFAADEPRPRVIDWSELKPGLGPHDLAYCLLSAPATNRPARDLALLRRYWEGLRAAGVEAYGWDLCQWDYRFSLLTNLFQSVFQNSLVWFRKTAALIAELDCRAALRSPPPM
ncbi:MAG TPA: aminoglycoside phosphotransferase family protein, partial [Kofleriaceae bacterium]|nr:aminoglycoside phosphotransferase family protein [Kofleriaceae bacterium]